MNGWIQRLKQLHLLLGILLALLLVLVIVSGSLSLYRAELDNLALPAAVRPAAAAATAVAPSQALALAIQHLDRQAPAASQWQIALPQPRQPYLSLHWQLAAPATVTAATTGRGRQSAGPQLYQQWLGLPDGSALTAPRQINFGATEHQLGGLFFQLHYNLLQLAGPASRSLVSYAALAWLLLSLAGLLMLTGRFAELLQWRLAVTASALPPPLLAVQQRRLRHNQLAVLTLPFALVFASSGWLTQMFSDNPAPMRQLYPANPFAFYSEFFPQLQPPASPASAGEPRRLPDFVALLAQAEAQLGGPIGKISIVAPGTSRSTVLFSRSAQSAVSNHTPALWYGPVADGSSDQPWQLLGATAEPGDIAAARHFWYGFHQSFYAGPVLRALLFLSGGLCCWMIWLGCASWLSRQSGPVLREVYPLTQAAMVALVLGPLVLVLHVGSGLPLFGSLPQMLLIWLALLWLLSWGWWRFVVAAQRS